MSQFYVFGSAYHFVGDGNGNFTQVGFCQRSTPVQFMAINADVAADYAGPGMPADNQFFGELAMFSPAFSRFNQTAVNTLLARRRGNTTPGQGAAGTIGSLMIAEGLTFPYAIVGGNRNKPVMAAGAMTGAYYFPTCYVADAVEMELSTEITVPRLIIRALPTFNQPDGSFVTYQLGLPSGISLPEVR